MCFGIFKKKVKPAWVTQTREECAEATLEAAATHYAWMIAIEEGGMADFEIAIGGDYAHHEYWWIKHQESAWYIENP